MSTSIRKRNDEHDFFAKNILNQYFHNFCSSGIENGEVRPLPRKIFPETEVEKAFRNVEASDKEKTVIQIRNEDPRTLKYPKKETEALSRITFHSNKSYVIIGGTTDIGLELTDWMIKRGAKKILLNGRRSNLNGYQLLCLEKWSQFENVLVDIETSDVTANNGAKSLISTANKLGPVGGKNN